ncbi:MAG TPA: MFS transporter [Flavobacteriales bacterium]|jgi:MFS family permease|nr:MFS transporter [Flavobacteriales bacterium]
MGTTKSEEQIDFRRNRQFWIMCFSTGLFFSSFNMIIPELPSYLESMGGAEYKGLIISLFTLTAMLSRPISGKLTDQIGRIPVMIFGATVALITSAFYPFLHTVTGFLFLRLVHGMSTGFKPTATSAYAADLVTPKQRGMAMGVLGVFTSSGMALGPTIGPVISELYGLDIMFYSSSALAFLSIALLVGMKETLENPKRMSAGMFRLKVKDFFEPNVLPAAWSFLLSVFPFGVILTIIPDYSDYLGISNRGTFFSIFVGSSILVRLLSGRASDRFGRIPVIILSTLTLAVAMVMIAYADSKNLLYAAAVVFGLSSGMSSPTFFAWTIDLSRPEFRGRAMSTLFISLELGIGIGALSSGWIYANDPGNFKITFLIAALSALGSTAFLIIHQLKAKKNPDQN